MNDLDAALQSRFGLASFRPWQREAIDALLGKPGRVLVVAPTGGGKSLTYQLPAALLPGVTLVLSPLVALMEDQVRALTARGIEATYLASTLDNAARAERERDILKGRFKLVYVAPERLGSARFVELLGRLTIDLVAIDEAHCISQWGHDFRPDYLRIGALLETLRPPRILACTATATPLVRTEIRRQLGLDAPPCHEVLRGFARPNLHLAARSVEGPREARALLRAELAQAIGAPNRTRGAAIVYAATRKGTEDYAKLLGEWGYDAAAYHAGQAGEHRSRVADSFAAKKLHVVAATNAFGMGIDRADIRTVVHVQPPSSIEAYYQEVGRAGRDGDEARGLLLCSGADIALRRRLVNSEGGVPAAPEAAARAWGLFRELLRYLDARSCRHDFVLRYFGDEQELLGGCGHCDVCVELDGEGEAAPTSGDLEATTVVVQKALSAVARANRRGGIGAIVEMLRGVESEKTRKFGFTTLSTFGLLKDKSEPWVVALLRSLLAAGWVDLTPTEHPVPIVTHTGAQIMKRELPARIVLPKDTAASGGGGGRRMTGGRVSREKPTLNPEHSELFERLRAHRAAVARERGVPAYVVALDRTLVEMAAAKPRTREDLLLLHGMGPARADQYGEGFLRVVAATA